MGALYIAIISVAAFIGPASCALAEDPIDEKGCDGSTYEMVDCLKAKTRQWDKRMNAAYQQKLKEAEPKQREQLRLAQRLWVQFRDANCLYYDLGEGTIARIDVGECMHRVTKSRAEELEGAGEQ